MKEPSTSKDCKFCQSEFLHALRTKEYNLLFMKDKDGKGQFPKKSFFTSSFKEKERQRGVPISTSSPPTFKLHTVLMQKLPWTLTWPHFIQLLAADLWEPYGLAPPYNIRTEYSKRCMTIPAYV